MGLLIWVAVAGIAGWFIVTYLPQISAAIPRPATGSAMTNNLLSFVIVGTIFAVFALVLRFALNAVGVRRKTPIA